MAPKLARVALVVPQSGPLGLTGPSCIACAELAREEVNAQGGLDGRLVDYVLVDGGRHPDEVVAEMHRLIRTSPIAAVVGMHTSSVRLPLARMLSGDVPYVYTPPYEGGENRLGVFHSGETPESQLRPALGWLVEHVRARRWLLLGNDYIWPRLANRLAIDILSGYGCEVAGEIYVPFGAGGSERVLDRVVEASVSAVLVNLVGQDLVAFNRAFKRAGLGDSPIRLSAALEENVLLASGGDASGGLFSSMGFFSNLVTEDSMAFLDRYVAAFGADAPPVTDHGQSCYEGMQLLAALSRRAGTLHPAALTAIGNGTQFHGARGRLVLEDGHVRQPVYLARADRLDLDVIAAL